MNLFYRGSKWVLRRTLWLFADYHVEGKENVPAEGSILVVANHQGNMDPPVVMASVPRDLKFPAKTELFNRPWARLPLLAWGAFPLKRGAPNPRVYKRILSELSKPNGGIVIFPEGTRSPRSMRRAKRGISTLVARSGVRIVPVGITGAEHMDHYLRVLNPTGHIVVRIGPPFSVTPDLSVSDHQVMEELTTEIMGRIASLIPKEYRGHYREAAEAPFRLTNTVRPERDWERATVGSTGNERA